MNRCLPFPTQALSRPWGEGGLSTHLQSIPQPHTAQLPFGHSSEMESALSLLKRAPKASLGTWGREFHQCLGLEGQWGGAQTGEGRTLLSNPGQ